MAETFTVAKKLPKTYFERCAFPQKIHLLCRENICLKKKNIANGCEFSSLKCNYNVYIVFCIGLCFEVVRCHQFWGEISIKVILFPVSVAPLHQEDPAAHGDASRCQLL